MDAIIRHKRHAAGRARPTIAAEPYRTPRASVHGARGLNTGLHALLDSLAITRERRQTGSEAYSAGITRNAAPRPAAGRTRLIDENDAAPECYAGQTIGRYKLRQLIGEGGFGAVYLAEQEAPVARRVALKLIKLGMDTRQVIARFEAERQALALMDHPAIARVFDAGATESGRPYFAMELVHGVPITEYCDTHNLPVAERVSLFIRVCEAVQHAHHKGVIHRDLKPSNVLVASVDSIPLPKVIDFGIAKATGQRLTDLTLVTEQRQFIGTPQYMSPEQAEGSSDVDTRSDIYALGVLLYELLTGATPFDPRTLRDAGLAEIQRTIREVDPQRPSTRIGADRRMDGPEIARRRKADPSSLSRTLRGDLDWIVMRCLEKDRARRYETANSLVQDLRAYLAHQPVAAGPPGSTYRLRKFVRRNRAGVGAAALIALALTLGTIGTLAGMVQARTERDRAVANAHLARNNEQFALAEAAQHPELAHRLMQLAATMEEARHLDAAERLYREALAIYVEHLGEDCREAQRARDCISGAVGAFAR